MTSATSCPDWAAKLLNGDSIIPPPLYPERAEEALRVFKRLRIVDAPGSPTFGEACGQWVFDFVAAIFGAYNAETGRRLLREALLLLPKKNCLGLATIIPTPTGWTTMESLKAGDFVIGADGKPTEVLDTSDVLHGKECYLVSFSNGESVIATDDHRWLTSYLNSPPDGRMAYRTTAQIRDTLLRPGDGARMHSMPMPAPQEGVVAELPIPPYTLGAWLGDGTSSCPNLTSHCDDEAVRAAIRAEGVICRYVRTKAGTTTHTYALTPARASNSPERGQLMRTLRKAGLLNNKHIPPEYLRASYSQRLSLLQGLMDTDGCASADGKVLSFTSTRHRLATDFCELLATMGIKYSITERRAMLRGKDCGPYWAVQFCVYRDHIPVFKLPRKLCRQRVEAPGRNLARSRTVQITGCERIASVPTKCITVAAADSQFLFGRSMLPTCNSKSTLAAGIMVTALVLNWRKSAELLILAPTIKIAKNAFDPARDMVLADPQLRKLLKVSESVRTITHLKTKALLKVLAADSDTVGGNKASWVLVDELWLFGKRSATANMFREAFGGLASRPEGIVIKLSTQSDEPPEGVFRDDLKLYRDIRDGLVVDDKRLPVLYEHPPEMVADGRAMLLENMPLVNPNYGRSVDAEFLRDEFTKAERTGMGELRDFLAKHGNVELGLNLRSDRWAGADFWEAQADPTLTLDTLCERSEVAVVGIDGGGLDDLLGLTVIGRCRVTRRWLSWSHAWAHNIVLERRKDIKQKLEDFATAGDLTLVEKPGDDVEDVCEIVRRLEDIGLLPAMNAVGVDPVGIDAIVDRLTSPEYGIDISRIKAITQGYRMSGAIKTTERALAGNTLVHCGQLMMAWCAGNAKVIQSGNATMVTKQQSGTAKIDPLLALFNACSLMALAPGGQGNLNDYLGLG